MSNTLEPNFNGLPKPTDWKKVIVPLQQANEKEFRGATLLELGDNLNIEMSINAQRVPAVPPGALVAGPADREVFMEIKEPGSWTWGTNPPLTNAQGNISTFYWDKTDWKKNDSAALPTTPVSNEFGNSTSLAISQAKVSALNKEINQVPHAEYYFGDSDISQGALFISGDFAYLINSPAIGNSSKAILFEYKAIATGTVILLHLRLQSDNSLLEVARQSFAVSSIGIKSHVIDLNVIPGDRFAVIGDGIVSRGVPGLGYFSAPTTRNPVFFNSSELVTPTQPTVGLGYHIKIAEVEGGLKSVIEDSVKKEDLSVISGKNKFNKLTMILLNKFVSNTGALETFNGAKAARTPAKPSTEYAFQLSRYEANSGGVIRFLRSDLSLISFVVGLNLPTSNSGIGKKLLTPAETAFIENTLYLSTTSFTDMTDTFQLEEGGSVTTYESYKDGISEIQGKKIFAESSSTSKLIPFINKRIVFLGDSITASLNYDYVARILTHMSFKSVVRLARSGATWTNTIDTVYDVTSTGGSTTSDNVIWNQVNRLKKMISDGLAQNPDIIYISAGTNDFGRPKGDITTAFTGAITGRTANQILTLTDAVRWNIELILAEWPNAQIILATPIQRGIADNSTIFNIGDLIEECGKRLSFHVIRQDQKIGVYGFKELNSPTFLYDFLHPNLTGANKIGDNVAPCLLSLISA
ncbi:SGNH/GDSL hydrolase family protein [Sphingobacterium faecium]